MWTLKLCQAKRLQACKQSRHDQSWLACLQSSKSTLYTLWLNGLQVAFHAAKRADSGSSCCSVTCKVQHPVQMQITMLNPSSCAAESCWLHMRNRGDMRFGAWPGAAAETYQQDCGLLPDWRKLTVGRQSDVQDQQRLWLQRRIYIDL